MAPLPGASRSVALGITAALVLAACVSAPEMPPPDGAAPGGETESGSAGGGSGTGASGAIPRDDVVAGLSEEDSAYLVDDPDTTWDVTYNNETQVLAGDALDALVDADHGAGEYVFDAAAAQAAGVTLEE